MRVRKSKSIFAARSGFTLIEMLTVAAILPLILVMLYTALDGTIEVANSTEVSQTNSQTIRSLYRMFDQDISACTLPPQKKTKIENADKSVYSLFLCKPKSSTNSYSLSFVTLRLSRSNRPQLGLNEVGYELQRNPDNWKFYKLVRREQHLYDDIPTSGGSHTEIYDKVISLEFSFFDGKEWVEKWDANEKHTLPYAVKITMEIELPSGEEAEAATIDTIVHIPTSKITVSKPIR